MKKENITFAITVITIASFLLGIFAIVMFAPSTSQDLPQQDAKTQPEAKEFIATGTTNATVLSTLDFLIVTCESGNSTSKLSRIAEVESVTPFNEKTFVVQIEAGKKDTKVFDEIQETLEPGCEPTIMQTARLSFKNPAVLKGQNESEKYALTIRDLNRMGSIVSTEFLKMVETVTRENDSIEVYVTALISNGIPTRVSFIEVPDTSINFATAESASARIIQLLDEFKAEIELSFEGAKKLNGMKLDNATTSIQEFKLLFEGELDKNEGEKLEGLQFATYLDNKTVALKQNAIESLTLGQINEKVKAITSKAFQLTKANATISFESENAAQAIIAAFPEALITRQAIVSPTNLTELQGELGARIKGGEFEARVKFNRQVNETIGLNLFAIVRGKTVIQIEAVEN